jgi:hypothetical protein
MSTIIERTSAHAVVTRQFESSRHDRANLAAAFERALPTIRRAVDTDRSPTASLDHPRRTRRAVS